MALTLAKEQREKWCGILLTLPLEYQKTSDHSASYKGATNFKEQCKELKDFVESLHDDKATFDVDQLKSLKDFVHEVYSVYHGEFKSSNATNVNSAMQDFFDMAPELEQLFQNWLDQFESSLISSPTTSTSTCNEQDDRSDDPSYVVSKEKEHKECPKSITTETTGPKGNHELSDTVSVMINVEKNSVSAGFHSPKVETTPEKIQTSNQKHSEAETTLKATQNKVQSLARELEASAKVKRESSQQVNNQEGESDLEEQHEKIQHLERDLEQSVSDRKKAEEQIKELQRKLATKDTALTEKKKELQYLETNLTTAEEQKQTYESRVKDCEEQLKTNEGILKHRDDVIHDLQKQLEIALKEKESYLMRLSKEMGAKVSSDESHMENISIKYRPMTVADDYHQLVADVWTEAKEKLDNEVKDMEEVAKLELLCTILKMSYNEVRQVYTDCKVNVFKDLVTLTGGAETETAEKEAENVGDCLPTAVKNHVADLFRMLSGSVSLPQIVQNVESRLQKESKEKYPETIFDDKMLHTYITGTSLFAWKMIVQRPPMEYDDSGIGEPHDGGKRQNVHYGSGDPEKEGAVVKTYVFPCLYHGKSMMVKGTVFIQ